MSEPQMPTASTRTCTSPGAGSSIGRSVSLNVRGAVSSAVRMDSSSKETILHPVEGTKGERRCEGVAWSRELSADFFGELDPSLVDGIVLGLGGSECGESVGECHCVDGDCGIFNAGAS